MKKTKNKTKKLLLTLGIVSTTILPVVTVLSCGTKAAPQKDANESIIGTNILSQDNLKENSEYSATRKTLTINNNVVGFEAGALEFYTSNKATYPIDDVILPIAISSIPSGVFNDLNLLELQIPASVTTIGDSAFVNSKIEDLVFEGSIPTIGGRSLTIQKDAFKATSLSSIHDAQWQTAISTSSRNAFYIQRVLKEPFLNDYLKKITLKLSGHNGAGTFKMSSMSVPVDIDIMYGSSKSDETTPINYQKTPLTNLTTGDHIWITAAPQNIDDVLQTPSVPYKQTIRLFDLEEASLHIMSSQDPNAKATNESTNFAEFSQQIDATHYLIGTISNGLQQVLTDEQGNVLEQTAVVTPGRDSLPTNLSTGWSQKIDATHFLIGAGSYGVFQVTVDSNGIVISTQPVLIVGAISIPDSSNGWAQRIDATHFLIGTARRGVYQVTVGKDGLVTKTKQLEMTGLGLAMPDVGYGWSEQIDATHFLIGTTRNGVYVVTVDLTTGMVTETKQVPTSGVNSIPDVGHGFIQKIDAEHYLIGTTAKGMYEVTLGALQKVISSKQVPTSGVNSIPDTAFGFGQQIDATHYLIGTARNGVYKVILDSKSHKIISSIPIPTAGEDPIPDVGHGFIQKIDSSTYWISTYTEGIWKLTI